MITEAQKAAQARYDAKTARYVSMKLNANTDKDIINRIYSEANVQGYLKRLIREDIAREQKEGK